MTRILSDWVGAFENATEFTGTPLRIRRWGAIACLAGALERKVWVRTKRTQFYPGLYTLLISPPGVGKSVILSLVRELWAGLDDHKLAAPSVSKASLIDELSDAARVLIHPGRNPPTIEFNSLKVLVSELGVFLPEYASDFMNVLTDVYDGYPFKERKRTKNLVIEIPKPQINFLSGTTPSYMNGLLPEGAWDQGFLSRMNLIYAGEITIQSPFDDSEEEPEVFKALRSDLKEIANLYGEVKIPQDVKEAFNDWLFSGLQPVPSHPKLQHYNTRRMGHTLKLLQVAVVNRTNELRAELQDLQRAWDWLFDAESSVPEIFKAMNSGGDSKVMDECWHMLFQYKLRYKKNAPAALVIEFVSRRVPLHNVERLLDLMEKSGLIRVVAEKGVGSTYEAKDRNKLL